MPDWAELWRASGAGAEFPALVPGCSEVSLAVNKQSVTSTGVIAKVTQDGLAAAQPDAAPTDAPSRPQLGHSWDGMGEARGREDGWDGEERMPGILQTHPHRVSPA